MIFVNADDVAALTETLVHPIRPSAVTVLSSEGGPTGLGPERYVHEGVAREYMHTFSISGLHLNFDCFESVGPPCRCCTISSSRSTVTWSPMPIWPPRVPLAAAAAAAAVAAAEGVPPAVAEAVEADDPVSKTV